MNFLASINMDYWASFNKVVAAAAADDAANSKGLGLFQASGEATLWGRPIPITWGRRRITGQLLQLGIQKQKTTVTTMQNHPWSIGYNGDFSTNDPYTRIETFFVSTFAYCFGAPGNPDAVQILRKLWFNGRLVYDIDQGYLSAEVRFKFYQGDELQVADAELNRDRYTHPIAYRGLMYVVFYEYAVAAMSGAGNPSVEAEFAEQVINTQPTYTFDNFGGSDVPGVGFAPGGTAYDAKKGILYVIGSDDNIYKYRGIDRVLIDVYPCAVADMNNGVFCFLRVAGVAYIVGINSGANSRALYLVNADTGALVSTCGVNGSALIPDETHYPGISAGTSVVFGDLAGEVGYVTCSDTFGNCAYTFQVVNGEMVYADRIDFAGSDAEWSITVRQGSAINVYTTGQNGDVYKNGVLFYTGEHQAGLIFASPLDNTIVFIERDTGVYNVTKLSEAGTVIWQLNEVNAPGLNPPPYSNHLLMQSNTGGQRIAWHDSTNVITLNFLSGSYEITDIVGSFPTSTNMIYDAYTHSFIRATGGSGAVEQRPILAQTTDNMLLSTLLRNLAERKGYATGNITIEGIPDTIVGAAITEVSDLDTILEDIRAAYNFEIIKRGAFIKFTRRGYGSDFEVDISVTEDQRAIVSEDNDEFVTVESTITSSGQTPGTIRLKYIDPDYNYAVAEFTHKRNADDADPSVEQNVALPIIMYGSEAAAIATRMLLNSAMNGLTHEFRLPQRYLAIEPGDTVDLVFDDYTDTVRAVEIAYNADWSMSIKSEAILTDIGPTYDLEPPVLPAENPALLQGEGTPIIFDTTLIRATDEVDGDVLELYVSAQPSGRLPVVGVNTLHKAIGTQPFSVYGVMPEALTFGTAIDVLPDVPPWQIDYLATLRLRLVQGDGTAFATDTVLNMLAGSNRLLVGQPGRWEQVGFIEAAYDAATFVVTLTGIVRGLRGTELNIPLHASSDYVVLIDADSMMLTFDYMTEFNNVVLFAIGDAVGRVNYADAAGAYVFGGARMPWAPSHVHVTAAGGDVELTWSRRTRLSGPLNNGNPDVPLDEAAELYTAVLYRAGVIVRTVEGLTSPAFTYTAAMQAADGWSGSIVALQLDLYQISELVGRGFPKSGTYDVE